MEENKCQLCGTITKELVKFQAENGIIYDICLDCADSTYNQSAEN